MKNDILEVETIFVFDDRIRLCFKIKVILVCSFIPFVCVEHALAKYTPSQKCTLGDEEKYDLVVHGSKIVENAKRYKKKLVAETEVTTLFVRFCVVYILYESTHFFFHKH